MLHVTNGDSTAQIIDARGLAGTVLPWRDVLHEGPIPAELPLTNYEISLQAKRLQGVDFFCGLTFPVGKLDRCASLILGGWGGSVTGISSIDDLDAANNATGSYQRYDDDKWYNVRLRVTPNHLSAWVDDKQVVDIDIKDRKVSLRAGPMEAYAPLSLTTYNTMAAIRNVVLRKL